MRKNPKNNIVLSNHCMRFVKEKELGKLYKFDELKKLGVKPGDIVAYRSICLDEGYCWDYVLLRKDFPEYFDTSLCCYKDPRLPNHTHLYQIGFHWCGSTGSFNFRLINEKEKDDFVNACIERLKIPYRRKYALWKKDHYAQILGALMKYNLMSEDELSNLNEELKKIHRVDLLKYYKKYWYNG